MIRWPLALAPLLALGAAAPAATEDKPLQFAQVIIREQIIVRVPVRVREAPQASRPIRWREGRGPKCLPMRAIAGAALAGENSVDLILHDNRRVRARLSSRCPALDYYRGFYIRPNEDGMICAERDIIRSRMGGQCEIERFRGFSRSPPTEDRLTMPPAFAKPLLKRLPDEAPTLFPEQI